MKKLILSFAIGIASTFAASSQNLLDNPNNTAYFGARMGLDITCPSNGYNVCGNGAGIHMGAVYNMPLPYKNLYFEPGLSLFIDTFTKNSLGQTIGDIMVPPVDGTVTNLGFRIPFMVGYHFDFTDDIKLFAFTGPQLNLSFVASQNWDETPGGEVLPDGSIFGDKGFKHFDLQWMFGAGMTYKQFYLQFAGGPGITKVFKLNDMSFRRNYVEFTLGYNFYAK